MNRGFAKKAEVLIHNPASGVCRKNEFLCANSVTLCVSVVKLPGKTFTTEARSYTEDHGGLFPTAPSRAQPSSFYCYPRAYARGYLLPPATQASSTLTKCGKPASSWLSVSTFVIRFLSLTRGFRLRPF